MAMAGRRPPEAEEVGGWCVMRPCSSQDTRVLNPSLSLNRCPCRGIWRLDSCGVRKAAEAQKHAGVRGICWVGRATPSLTDCNGEMPLDRLSPRRFPRHTSHLVTELLCPTAAGPCPG